jgi:hypothetical protein
VTHYDDPVPHFPTLSRWFSHAGHEVWYTNPGADITFRICDNEQGKRENQNCAGSIQVVFTITKIETHKTYVGKRISNLCQ